MPKAESKGARWKALLEFVRRRFGKKPPPSPADPYTYVRAPLKHSPKGRSGAAVAEFEDDSPQTFPPRRS